MLCLLVVALTGCRGGISMKAAKFTTHRGGRRHVCCLSVRLSDLVVLGFGCIFIKVHVATFTACCKCVCLEGGKSDIFDNAKKEKWICDCQRHKLIWRTHGVACRVGKSLAQSSVSLRGLFVCPETRQVTFHAKEYPRGSKSQ